MLVIVLNPKMVLSLENGQIEYNECLDIINKLKIHEESDIFAMERNKGLEAIIGNIYQTFDGNKVYKSIEGEENND